MKKDLTKGRVASSMLLFAGPMILGNLLQQCYNIGDTLIVGRFLGAKALAAVGSAYTLMTFLNSIFIGLCMGSGAVFSYYFGKKDRKRFQKAEASAFVLIGAVTIGVNLLVFAFTGQILALLQVPGDVLDLMEAYVNIIFAGIFFVFLYNYFSFLLRAVGNSLTPLCFLGSAAVLNLVLDLVFVVVLESGVKGAAWATVLSQGISGAGLGIYTWCKEPSLRLKKEDFRISGENIREIFRFSGTTCIQQSVMNLGILMIQGLVNGFGSEVMAAFAAAVKIDSFAYMPAQEFGNAFSLFISQNYGAGEHSRVKEGIRCAGKVSAGFCLAVSAVIVALAPKLMTVFVNPKEQEIISIGAGYLRVEGAFYVGIGILFLLYGYYRAIERPEMSVVLTVISLGTRVLLAYVLSPVSWIGVWGIWWAIPIGWALADCVGLLVMKKMPFKCRE